MKISLCLNCKFQVSLNVEVKRRIERHSLSFEVHSTNVLKPVIKDNYFVGEMRHL